MGAHLTETKDGRVVGPKDAEKPSDKRDPRK